MNLIGKHILFVGCDTGIDEAIKSQLKDLGADLVLYENNEVTTIEPDLKSLVKEVGTFDGVVFAHVHSDFKPLQFVKPELVN